MWYSRTIDDRLANVVSPQTAGGDVIRQFGVIVVKYPYLVGVVPMDAFSNGHDCTLLTDNQRGLFEPVISFMRYDGKCLWETCSWANMPFGLVVKFWSTLI